MKERDAICAMKLDQVNTEDKAKMGMEEEEKYERRIS